MFGGIDRLHPVLPTHRLRQHVKAFALPATSLADLVAVSDRGGIMPPKSTWFWPKPASGLPVHPLR